MRSTGTSTKLRSLPASLWGFAQGRLLLSVLSWVCRTFKSCASKREASRSLRTRVIAMSKVSLLIFFSFLLWERSCSLKTKWPPEQSGGHCSLADALDHGDVAHAVLDDIERLGRLEQGRAGEVLELGHPLHETIVVQEEGIQLIALPVLGTLLVGVDGDPGPEPHLEHFASVRILDTLRHRNLQTSKEHHVPLKKKMPRRSGAFPVTCSFSTCSPSRCRRRRCAPRCRA